MDPTDFRRAVDFDVWHWDPNCEKWPAKTFECSKTRPLTDKMCRRCEWLEAHAKPSEHPFVARLIR